jgi:hypothetical protein
MPICVYVWYQRAAVPARRMVSELVSSLLMHDESWCTYQQQDIWCVVADICTSGLTRLSKTGNWCNVCELWQLACSACDPGIYALYRRYAVGGTPSLTYKGAVQQGPSSCGAYQLTGDASKVVWHLLLIHIHIIYPHVIPHTYACSPVPPRAPQPGDGPVAKPVPGLKGGIHIQ